MKRESNIKGFSWSGWIKADTSKHTYDTVIYTFNNGVWKKSIQKNGKSKTKKIS